MKTAKPATKRQKMLQKKRAKAAAEQQVVDELCARINGNNSVRLPPEKGA